MKRKNMALFLGLILVFSGSNILQINAEDTFDDGTEVVSEEESEDKILTENDQTATDISEDIFEQKEDLQQQEIDISGTQDTGRDSSDDTTKDDFSSGEENSEILSDISDNDNSYNIKSFTGIMEKSNILVGENPEEGLKIYYSQNDLEKTLNKSNYIIRGFITEEEYERADCCPDNMNQFKSIPDETGTWYMIVEGVTPYYGRQAVCVTVHDVYDISMYDWSLDNDYTVGETPEGSLKVFVDKNNEQSVLEKNNYTVLGYVTEEQYIKAEYNLDKLSDFSRVPETSGQWLIVFEGVGKYHGRQSGIVEIKDQYDLGMYQCQITNDKIVSGDDVSNFLEVKRLKDGNSQILNKDNYKIIGYIREKDFIDCGYNTDTENIQNSVNEIGSWYVLIEGTGPYYGKLATCFEVYDNETVESVESTDATIK